MGKCEGPALARASGPRRNDGGSSTGTGTIRRLSAVSACPVTAVVDVQSGRPTESRPGCARQRACRGWRLESLDSFFPSSRGLLSHIVPKSRLPGCFALLPTTPNIPVQATPAHILVQLTAYSLQLQRRLQRRLQPPQALPYRDRTTPLLGACYYCPH